MVLANLLRQNLLEPLKERQRREGWEEGYAEGYEEGFAVRYAEGLTQGRAEADAIWCAWNARREKAEARGEPFGEPPPSFDA